MQKWLYNPKSGIGYDVNNKTTFLYQPLVLNEPLEDFLSSSEIGLFYECLFTSFRLRNKPIIDLKTLLEHELKFVEINSEFINSLTETTFILNHFVTKLEDSKQQWCAWFFNLLINNRQVILSNQKQDDWFKYIHKIIKMGIIFDRWFFLLDEHIENFWNKFQISSYNEKIKDVIFNNNQYYEIDYHNDEIIIDFKTYNNNKIDSKQNIDQINRYEQLLQKKTQD